MIQDLLLREVLRLGARMANAGEFSLRAYLNDKIDLIQAEAIADLIESRTISAAKSATRSLQGDFSKQINQLVQKVTALRVFVEAAIDFPDEDIDFLAEGKVADQLADMVQYLEHLLSKARAGVILKEGIRIVIAGLPNVGKSSLMNVLSNRETAIVTNIAGTTRDLIQADIQINGIPIHLVDTAGLRNTDNIVEQKGIARAKQQMEQADLILWLYDAVENPTNADYLNQGLTQTIPHLIIRNKIDLLGETPAINKTNQQIEISVSLLKQDGLTLLQDHICETVLGNNIQPEGQFIARRRHLDLLIHALEFLKTGLNQIEMTGSGELLADDLKEAQNLLGEITGKVSSDQLLGEIFSNFCIGK